MFSKGVEKRTRLTPARLARLSAPALFLHDGAGFNSLHVVRNRQFVGLRVRLTGQDVPPVDVFGSQGEIEVH